MPKIGDINVPDELWQELVLAEAYKMVETVFEAVGTININLTAKLAQIPPYLRHKNQSLEYHRGLNQRLIELIKAQAGIDEDTLKSIKETGEFHEDKIMLAVFAFVDQVAFDALFNISDLEAAIKKKLKASSPPPFPLD